MRRMAVLLMCGGCSLATPGLDTRIAHEGRIDTSWVNETVMDGDGRVVYPDGIVIGEATTHNRKILTVEGENASIEFGPDGAPKSVSNAVAVMWQQSRPEDVSSSYMHLATKNAQVAEAMIGAVSQLTAAIAPILAQRLAPTTQPTGGTP